MTNSGDDDDGGEEHSRLLSFRALSTCPACLALWMHDGRRSEKDGCILAANSTRAREQSNISSMLQGKAHSLLTSTSPHHPQSRVC